MLTLKCQEMEKELKLNEVMALLTGLPGPAKEEKPADSGTFGSKKTMKKVCIDDSLANIRNRYSYQPSFAEHPHTG